MHRTYADIRKAERFLQYQPKVPIEQGICLFVTWYNERKKTNGINKMKILYNQNYSSEVFSLC